MSDAPKAHKGLSPSSLALYQACPRKYKLKKIDKIANDSDYVEDTAIFAIGKAFHKVCEDSMHDLTKISVDEIKGIVELYQLQVDEWYPMIKVMLDQYHKVHVKSGLEVIACEQEIETEFFYGIVDVVLKGPEGWWIGDLKTAGSFSPTQVPGLLSHPQLNLYAAHSPFLARNLGLDIKEFKGCRYRVTTKSKLQRKVLELEPDYMARLAKSITSQDFVLPVEQMIHRQVYAAHKQAFAEISKGDKGSYPPNYANCFAYFRPCELWSNCHGRLCSETGSIKVISNGDK